MPPWHARGLLPVPVFINPFLSMHTYEQVRDDLGYMNNKVVIVSSGGSPALSPLGSTHIAVEAMKACRAGS